MSKSIFIPARLASTRFPNKILADVKGKSMIQRVYEQCLKTGIKDVFVACCDEEVFEAVEKFKGTAIMTNPNHVSGTDRIYEALCKVDKSFDFIVNVQGDIPLIEPNLILKNFEILENYDVDISTLCSIIVNEKEKTDPNIVKVIMSFRDELKKYARGIYFTRATAPYGEGSLYHHIGIYGYKREALKAFVNYPESALEKREKLEQLRAIENGMKIGVSVVEQGCLGVDTKEDLEKIDQMLI